MEEFLAKRASEDYEPINFYFLDKDLMMISHDKEESMKYEAWSMKYAPWVYKLLLTKEWKD